MANFKQDGPGCCGCGGGGGGPVTQVNCPCTGTPGSLTLSCTYGPGHGIHDYNGYYISTTLTFMATPPAYAPGAGANRYFSPSFTTDFGETAYYMLFCPLPAGGYMLGNGYDPPGPGYGLYYWVAGVACSPFLLSGPSTTGAPVTYPSNFSVDGGIMTAS